MAAPSTASPGRLGSMCSCAAAVGTASRTSESAAGGQAVTVAQGRRCQRAAAPHPEPVPLCVRAPRRVSVLSCREGVQSEELAKLNTGKDAAYRLLLHPSGRALVCGMSVGGLERVDLQTSSSGDPPKLSLAQGGYPTSNTGPAGQALLCLHLPPATHTAPCPCEHHSLSPRHDYPPCCRRVQAADQEHRTHQGHVLQQRRPPAGAGRGGRQHRGLGVAADAPPPQVRLLAGWQGRAGQGWGG